MGRFIGYLSIWAGRNRRLSVAGGWLRRSRGLLLGDGNAGAAAEGLVHFSGGVEALLRGVGAGFQHDRFQLRTAVGRRRQGLAGETALACFLILSGQDLGGRQGHKGHPAVIEQPIQHQAQRIEVRAASVGAVVIHLGRHVFISADLGAAHGPFHGFGNTEITQLIIAVGGDENVLGLDVPVDDIVFFAEHQRAANVPADLQDGFLGHRAGQRLRQGREQLHADENVPADAVAVLDIADVLAVYGVGAAVQLAHEGILGDDVLQMGAEGGGDALIVIPLAVHFRDIRLVLGDGDDLHRRGLRGPVHQLPPELINGSKAPPSNQPHRLPPRPGGFL